MKPLKPEINEGIIARIGKGEDQPYDYEEDREAGYAVQIENGIVTVRFAPGLFCFYFRDNGRADQRGDRDERPGEGLLHALLQCEEPLYHRPRAREGIRAEEYPCERDKTEGERDPERTPHAALFAFARKLIRAERKPVEAAPEHEGPVCAVLEPAEQHGEEQVEVLPRLAPAVAAEGYV